MTTADLADAIEPCPRCGNQPQIKAHTEAHPGEQFFTIKCCGISTYDYSRQEAINLWVASVAADRRHQNTEARTAEREGLAATIERALQSDKSALIVFEELRPLLPEVVRVLRERQEESK